MKQRCNVTVDFLSLPPPSRDVAKRVSLPLLVQDTTFNQNLSYTILSWPEEHVQDLLELWRLQVLFFATIIFNILVSALLYFTENPDRRVAGEKVTASAATDPRKILLWLHTIRPVELRIRELSNALTPRYLQIEARASAALDLAS